jgi:hypothetical protein
MNIQKIEELSDQNYTGVLEMDCCNQFISHKQELFITVFFSVHWSL